MTWAPFIITAPIPVLAGLLLLRVFRHPEESFKYMALSSEDVNNAMKLLMLGFISLTLMLFYSAYAGSELNLTMGMLVGTFTAVTMNSSLVMLNIAARNRRKWYYALLPSQVKNRFKE